MPAVQQLVEFDIKVGGQTLDISGVARMEAVSALNRAASLVLSVHDPGDPGSGDSRSDDSQWALGQTIEVKAKGAGETSPTTIFSGEITALEIEVEAGLTYFTVRAHDKLQRLYHGTRQEAHVQRKYSDLISAMAGRYGLSADVAATTQAHRYLAQAGLSDGDLLTRLAREIGYVFFVRDAKLVCRPPQWSASPACQVKSGEDLLRFRAVQSTEAAAEKVIVTGWDVTRKQAITGQTTTVKTNGSAVPTEPAAAFKRYGGTAVTKVSGAPVANQEAATNLAEVFAERIGDAGAMAEGVVRGQAKILAGTTIDVQEVPARFAGKYYVTEARHVFTSGEYEVEFRCTGALDLALGTLSQSSSAPVPAAPLHQPHPFVVLPAIVTNNKYAEDSTAPGTWPAVKVKIPMFDDQIESEWCRLVTAGAGPTATVMFVPEVNDEVLVAFEGGDLRRGYVLGGLYNGVDKPKAPFDAGVVTGGKVVKRGVTTPKNQQVVLDDTNSAEKVELLDKEAQQLLLDAANKKIIVKAGENSVEIDNQGGKITIKAKQTMVLEAPQGIELKADTGKVTIQAGQDVEVKGMGVKAEAQGQLQLKGAMAELNGSGQTAIKGGMVMIN